MGCSRSKAGEYVNNTVRILSAKSRLYNILEKKSDFLKMKITRKKSKSQQRNGQRTYIYRLKETF